MGAADTPWRDDRVTIGRCIVCANRFVANGRRRYCSDACRQRAFRRRHSSPMPALAEPVPRAQVIYECAQCEARYLGERRCPDCNLFCRRVGPGGACPHCDEPVALADLLGLGS